MTTAPVTFVGVDDALADLKRWADQLAGEIAEDSGTLGTRVADTIRGKVPRLSGQLAGSVTSGGLEDGVEVSMGLGLEYAGWIEFGGTRGRSYVPEGRYVYPSALDASDEFEKLAAQTATDSVGGFSWSTPSH